MTFRETREGWLCLAGVLDTYSQKIVGWAMDKQHNTALVEAALHMALQSWRPAAGLIHYSYAWNLPKTLQDETLNEDNPLLEYADRAGDAALEPDG